MELTVFSLEEGKIVEKLLLELSGEGTLKSCLRIADRPLALSGLKLVVFAPSVDPLLKELLKNLEQIVEVEVYTSECFEIKNCHRIEGFYPLEALKKFLKNNGENLLAAKLENFEPQVEENETVNLLKEKLGIYIPLAVSKRESVSYGWKYYLSLKRIPCVSFLHPAEEQNFLNTLSDIGFRDKVFPLLLGTFEEPFLSRVKEKGFIPYIVKPKNNQKLLSELDLIYTAKVVSEGVFIP